MKRSVFLGVSLLAVSAYAADSEKKLSSGCKDGQGLRPFTVAAVTGPEQGRSLCYI